MQRQLPNHPNIFLTITKIFPGGTEQQLQWLIAVLQDLRFRVLAAIEPKLLAFSTDITEIVFSAVGEVRTSMPLEAYVRARTAIAEGLELLESLVRQNNAAQLEGQFSLADGIPFARFRAAFAGAVPVIPQPEPIAGRFSLSGGGTELRVTQRLGIGDGWDMKHCYDTLSSIIRQLASLSSPTAEGFSARTGGPGEWTITFKINRQSSESYLRFTEIAMLSRLRDLIRLHGVTEMEFSLYGLSLHRNHGSGSIVRTIRHSDDSDLALDNRTTQKGSVAKVETA